MDKEKDIEIIVEVSKSDTVQKFNPFHDARGRFASSRGFKTYSANPNTKAGAMAIARSAAAGYGKTPNVHRQSGGNNIQQITNWLGQGKQANTRQRGYTTLRQRIEPVSGLAGAAATGAAWQAQNQKMGYTTTGGKRKVTQTPKQTASTTQQTTSKPSTPTQKPAAQKPQITQQQKPATQSQQTIAKPSTSTQRPAVQQNTPMNSAKQPSFGSKTAQQKALGVDNVKLTSREQLGIQPRNKTGQVVNTTKVAKDHYQEHVVGKDISSKVDVSKIKGNKDPIDKIAEAQGWNKGSTVTNDLETFQKASVKSGYMFIRSVHNDSRTGKTGLQICKDTMTNGNSPLGGSGAQFYGSGLYTVGVNLKAKGTRPSTYMYNSQEHSYGYGDKQMIATVHPSAKIATPQQAGKLKSQFFNMSSSEKAKFGNDYGAYIASKGYDGVRWHDDSTSSSTPYITMYNKSAMIFYGGASSRD